ncbi:leucine-rich colipase-like protein 1 [Sminthopsis crassicaudata]|uniref:leucine-rich colipase-like protein 1 n=1 Tax=Sminthopsis crassicaudata TaxID=9301 RepID=UPI003D693C84
MGDRRCGWQPRPLPASHRPTPGSPPSVVPAPPPLAKLRALQLGVGGETRWVPRRRAGLPVLGKAGMLLGPFTKVAILKLLLTSFLLSGGSMKYHKGIGELCQKHLECFSECCILDKKMVKRCVRRTLFLQCKDWKKPFGKSCHHSSECQSNCCIPVSSDFQSYCASRTMFMQCIPWRKEKGSLCSSHEECKSNCCLRKYEGVFHCIPKTGVLQKCFLPNEKKLEIEEEVTTIGTED